MAKHNDIYNHSIDYDPDTATDDVTSVADITDKPRKKSKSKSGEPQKNNNEKVTREWPAFIRFFMDKRTHSVFGIGLILLAAYIAIAALSYFSTAANDQSKLNNLSVEEMIHEGLTVENITGPMGANTAHILLTHGLGIGSLVLVIYLVFLGLTLIGAKKNLHFWSLTLKCIVSAIGISLIAGIIDLYLNLESVFPYGGAHGRFINLWLISRIDWIGDACVCLFIMAVLIYIYINDIAKFTSRVVEAYRKTRPAIIEAVDTAADDLDDNIDETANDLEHSAYLPHDDTENNSDSKLEMLPVNVSFDNESLPHEYAIEIKHTTDQTEDNKNPKCEEQETNDLPESDHSRFMPPSDEEENFNSESDISVTHDDISNQIADNSNNEVINVSPDFDINITKIEEGKEDQSELYDPTAELSRYERPPLDLLIARSSKGTSVDREEQDQNKERII